MTPSVTFLSLRVSDASRGRALASRQSPLVTSLSGPPADTLGFMIESGRTQLRRSYGYGRLVRLSPVILTVVIAGLAYATPPES